MALAALKIQLQTWDAAMESCNQEDYEKALQLFDVRDFCAFRVFSDCPAANIRLVENMLQHGPYSATFRALGGMSTTLDVVNHHGPNACHRVRLFFLLKLGLPHAHPFGTDILNAAFATLS